MSNWDNIKDGVGRAASKTVHKTEELASSAAMHVKLTALNAKRNGLFEKLGRLTYKQLKSGEDSSRDIATLVTSIDKISEKINAQKIKIELAKAEKQEKKNQERAASEQAKQEQQKAYADNVKNIIEENK